MTLKPFPFSLAIAVLVLAQFITACSTESTPVYNLTTAVEPAEAGSIEQNAFQAEDGQSIKITATPNEHWQFVGWSGDFSGSNQPTVNVFMDRDRTVTALFEKVEYPVTIDITGEGDVLTEIVSQKSITEDFPHATVLQLTAEPATGWEFLSWGGAAEGNDTITTVEVDGPVEVTATFGRIDYKLIVTVEGGGQVEQQILPTTTTETEYPFETMVQLTAVANFGWEFDRWEGGASGTDPVVIVDMLEQTEITAFFTRQNFTLEIQVIGGEGNVQKRRNGAITSLTEFPFETEIELTAVAASGWALNAWALEDDTVIQDDTITISMNGNRVIRVEFYVPTPTRPTVTINNVSNIGETTATVSGNVVERGSAPVTERGFVYTSSANPTANDLQYISAGSGTGPYTANLTGLTPGTLYYVSPYAVNQAGTTSGPGQLTFTTAGTPPSTPPPSDDSGGGDSGGGEDNTPPPSDPPPTGGTQVGLVFLDGVNFDVTLNGTLIPASQGFDYTFGSAGVKVVNLSGNIQSMALNPDQIKVSGLNNEGFGSFGYKMVNKNSDANLYAINANDNGNPEFWGQPATTNPLGVINNRSGDTVFGTQHPDPLFYLGWRFDPVNQPNNRTFQSQWSGTGKMVITFFNYGQNHGSPAVP